MKSKCSLNPSCKGHFPCFQVQLESVGQPATKSDFLYTGTTTLSLPEIPRLKSEDAHDRLTSVSRPVRRLAGARKRSPSPPGRTIRPSDPPWGIFPISNRAVSRHSSNGHVPITPFRSWHIPMALEPAVLKGCSPKFRQNSRKSLLSGTETAPRPVPTKVQISVHVYDLTAEAWRPKPHEVVHA